MPKTISNLEDFEILATIGSGMYGTCKQICRKSDKKILVWKEVNYHGMSEKEKQLLVQEVNLLRELRHPNIVRYHDRIIDRANSMLYIIMEYCEGGSLADIIAQKKKEGSYIKESFISRVLYQLLLALKHCHKKREGMHKILHRDLKPANVFLDRDLNVKLGDFGLARILHHNFSLAKTFVGSPYYMSPEQFTQELYDEKSDLWSLGCLVYELCALCPPFMAPNEHVLAIKVREGHFKQIPRTYSSDLQAIIADLLQVQPCRRPGIDGLVERVLTLTAQVHSLPQASLTDAMDQRERELIKREQLLIEKELLLAEKEKRLLLREKSVAEKEKLQRVQIHRRYPLVATGMNS